MPTLTFNVNVVDGANATTRLSPAVTAASELVYDATVAPTAVNQPVAGAFAIAKVKAVYLTCTADCTLKTNSTSTPGQTIPLKAGVPLLWMGANDSRGNPFTVDVTTLYATSTAGGQLTGNILLDI